MKKHIFLIIMLTVGFIILTACGNSSEKSSNNPSLDTSPIQKVDIDDSENSTENISDDQRDTSENTATNSNDDRSLNSDGHDSAIAQNNKEEYLKKLNEMEEADRNLEAGKTIVELEEQESDRYKKWDAELNEIYEVLREQLNEEEMDRVKEEQRNWIKHRDEMAKESSLKYKGGSTESLEYVATQASLTRERCYELVAKYIK